MQREFWALLGSVIFHMLIAGYLVLSSPHERKAEILDVSFVQSSKESSRVQSRQIPHAIKELSSTNILRQVGNGTETAKEFTESKAQALARTESLEKWSEMAPSLQRVEKFLDEIIVYESNLASQEVEGTVSFEMEVSRAGEIVRIDHEGATGPDKLVGYVLGVLVKNKSKLSCQMQNTKLQRDILPIIVRIQFSLLPTEYDVQNQKKVGQQMNVINLYKTRGNPLAIQLSEGRAGRGRDEERGVQANLNVLHFLSKLFKEQESENSRLSWDLKRKLREAINECKDRGAEGACYFVGKTLTDMGESKLAIEYFDLSCKYGYTLACEKIEKKMGSM